MKKSNSESWFGEYAHRWPAEALAMGYAMACVEIVSNNSERAGPIYRDILDAWGKPGIKTFYDQIISKVPDAEKEDWKQKLRFPESVFGADTNKPWTDLVLSCIINRNKRDSSLTLRMTTWHCHPERSEGSRSPSYRNAD